MTQRTRAAAADTNDVERTGVRTTSRRPAPPSELELKLARARAAIARMAPDDPRARLLQVAVLRRDEILVEALLRRVESLAP